MNGKTDKLNDRLNRIYIRYHRVNALYNRIYTTIEQDYRKKEKTLYSADRDSGSLKQEGDPHK